MLQCLAKLAWKANFYNSLNSFGQLSYSNIGGAQYKRLMAKSDEDKQTATTCAALELFVFNIEWKKNKSNNLTRLEELEAKVNKLKLDTKAANNKANKLEAEKKIDDSIIFIPQTELAHQILIVKDKEALLNTLVDKMTNLTLKVEELEAEKAEKTLLKNRLCLFSKKRAKLEQVFATKKASLACQDDVAGNPSQEQIVEEQTTEDGVDGTLYILPHKHFLFDLEYLKCKSHDFASRNITSFLLCIGCTF